MRYRCITNVTVSYVTIPGASSHSNCHERLSPHMALHHTSDSAPSQDTSVVSGGFPKGLGTLKSRVYIPG